MKAFCGHDYIYMMRHIHMHDRAIASRQGEMSFKQACARVCVCVYFVCVLPPSLLDACLLVHLSGECYTTVIEEINVVRHGSIRVDTMYYYVNDTKAHAFSAGCVQ